VDEYPPDAHTHTFYLMLQNLGKFQNCA
jgi:hypothetical protein